MMTCGSLFSGIEGFGKGLELAGLCKVIWHSEIDKYASAVHKYHYPELKNYGDATGIIPDRLPETDIITFGWPCQDNSIAGKRKGHRNGTRSNLLTEAVRIIGAKKPKYFIAENVPGLFSVNGGYDFYKAIRLFTDIGYDCQWQVLNTRWFLPQNRERIYIVGHLAGERRPKIFPVGESTTGFNERSEQTPVNTLSAGGHSGGYHSSMTLLAICDSGVSRTKQIRTKTLPPLRANTGAGHDNLIAFGNSQDQKISIDISQTLNAGHYNQPKIVQRPHGFNKGGKKELPSLRASRMEQNDFLKQGTSIRRLTPVECERLQGFSDDWTKYGIYPNSGVKEISNTQRYKMIGNAVSVPVVQAIAELFIEASPMPNRKE